MQALSGDACKEVARLQGRLSVEEAALFDSGRASVAEFHSWRGSRVRALPACHHALCYQGVRG